MPRRARGPAPEEDMKVAKPSSSSPSAAVAAAAVSSSSSLHPPKRQRVSLACDACRMARERCDGARPQCGTCTSVGRDCSYTPTLRKRGIKTGYLRAVELSLAWLLARASADEEALHQLFVDNGGGLADQLFVAKGKASDRLYKKWVGGRIYADIDRILSEDRPAKADMTMTTTDDDDDHSEVSPGSTEHGPGSVMGGGMASTLSSFAKPEPGPSQVPALTQIPATQRITYPKLPSSWRRLVDIYLTYTHCWLPIVQQEEIYLAAMLYTADGLQMPTSSDPYATACHAQLWAVLAMASFQDAHAWRRRRRWREEDASAGSGSSTSLRRIYEFAKGLIPNDDANLERPMACAMLLHAVILMGRGNGIAAWLMVGRAARLILVTESDLSGGSGGVDRRALAKCPALAACCVLDAVLSACLDRPAQIALTVETTTEQSAPLFSLYPESAAAGPWRPLSGFGSEASSSSPFSSSKAAAAAQPATSHPSLTLYQLLEFSLRTVRRRRGGGGGGGTGEEEERGGRRRGNDDGLVQSLHPQLLFCSSLNVGAPRVPSAVLLQVAFLASSILVAGCRASLLFTLLELVELSVEHFGEAGTAPLVPWLMRSVERQVDFAEMRPGDGAKWSLLLERLRSPWEGEGEEEEDVEEGRRDGDGQVGVEGQGSGSGYRPGIRDPPRLQLQAASSLFSPQPFPGGYEYETASSTRLNAGQSPTLDTPSVHLQASPHPLLHDAMLAAAGPSMDYDAMLDELGSINYTDSVELDGQFMVNLGFAPGCKTPDHDSVGDFMH